MIIYIDESGESKGFKPDSSKTFNIAAIKVDDPRKLKKAVKKLCSKVLNAGWPKNVEIKAFTLYGARHNRKIPINYKYKASPEIPILGFLNDLTKTGAQIDYITVLKEKIFDPLKEAPPFVIYNFVAGKIITHNASTAEVIRLNYDTRSKETKNKKRFDSYALTEAYKVATHPRFRMSLEECDSKIVHGIKAVDIVSWAVHRQYEHGDKRFLGVIGGIIDLKQEWFYK